MLQSFQIYGVRLVSSGGGILPAFLNCRNHSMLKPQTAQISSLFHSSFDLSNNYASPFLWLIKIVIVGDLTLDNMTFGDSA